MKNIRQFLEHNGFVRIPLRKINSNHFAFSLQINGVSGRFILDTGASNSCVALEFVDYFCMKTVESEVKAAGAGATNMEALLSPKNRLQIGGWHKRNSDFVVFDMAHINQALRLAQAETVHGILGADVLKTARAVIDYGRNCMYLK